MRAPRGLPPALANLDRTLVMGILNVTPDSFSDGGRYGQRDAALRHAEAMLQAGATLIDVGGESTRPGARAVSPVEELERVAPVVEAIARELDVIKHIKEGLSSKEISTQLNISLKTVEVHRHNILKKLNLKNSAALVNYINSSGLVI